MESASPGGQAEHQVVLCSALLENANAESMIEFSQQLSRRNLDLVDLGTTALSLLAGTYFSQVWQDFKPSSYGLILSAKKKLLQYAVSLLDHCGMHYTPVFRLIHTLCGSSGVDFPLLSSEDIAMLQDILKHNRHILDNLEGDKRMQSDKVQEESIPIRSGSPVVNTKVQVQKMYSHMIRRSPGGGKQIEKLVVNVSPMKLTSQGGELLKACLCHFYEIEGDKKLIKFCQSLPVFDGLSEFKTSCLLAASKSSCEKMLMTRLQQLKDAVEAVSITVNLVNTPSLSSPSILQDLMSLILSCISAASIATYSLSALNAVTKRVTSTQKDELADSVSTEQEPAPSSVKELLNRLSCCRPLPQLFSPSFSSLHAVKLLVNEIVTIVWKMLVKMENMIKDSAETKGKVDTFRTIVAYHVLSGLLPLITAKSVTESSSNSLWLIRMNMPLSRMLCFSVHFVSTLLENAEQSEGTIVSTLQITDIDVTEAYSCSQLSHFLIHHLPLLNILVSVIVASLRKATSLVNSPPRDDSQTEIGSIFTSIKPGKKEKEEHIFRRVKFALSAEKLSSEGTRPSDVNDCHRSPSPSRTVSTSSTVSSSGEVQGEYVVNAANSEDVGDRQHNEQHDCQDNGEGRGVEVELADDENDDDDDDDDEEEEEEEDEEEEEEEEGDESDDYSNHSMDPFLQHLVALGLTSTGSSHSTPPPPASANIPTPPPLPPKVSKPLSFLQSHLSVPQDTPICPKGSEVNTKPLFYLELGVISLHCLQKGLVCNGDQKVCSYVHENLTADHISALASMFVNVHSILQSGNRSHEFSKMACFENFVISVTELVHELVVKGFVKLDHHGMMLREMGLHQGCWSLAVIPKVLSLLARVLIYRLQVLEDQDDPLSVSIWKGFITTLEDNAVNENEPDEDLDVTHLQLLLFVWHSFTIVTRNKLLQQCVSAVIKVAEEKRSGVVVPPVPVCRLLLVLDYMLFQFSELDKELVKQVTHNLLLDGDGSASPVLSPQPPGVTQASSHALHYPSDHQLQYQRIMSKPGSSINKEEHAGVFPCFYNVRCHNSDSGVEKGIDPEACTCVLRLCNGEQTYEIFHDSLIVLMSCGASYQLHSDLLLQRIMSVCAGHHCFNLCLDMLTHLPPSYSTLTAIVDNASLTCKDQHGACSVIFALIFSIKLRLQHFDMEDIVDTLTEMGHDISEAEELVGKVISVVDSTDHFILQTIPLLDEFCSVDIDTMLPLLSISSIDLLMCLLQRALQSIVDEDEEEVERARKEEKESEEEREREREKKQAEDEKEKERDGKDAEIDPTSGERIYDKHAGHIVPVLLKVAAKLTDFSHIYICSDIFHQPRLIAEEMEGVVSQLLKISSKLLIHEKIPQSLFFKHLPESTHERLKHWNQALLIDREHKQITVPYSDNLSLIEELRSFLDLSYTAFAGLKTFDPARLLKSAMFTLTSLLQFFLELCPKKSIDEFLSGVIPLATDLTYEFLASDRVQGLHCQPILKQIAEFVDESKTINSFSQACICHIVKESFSLVVCPAISGHTFQGSVLEDVFGLLTAMLDNSVYWPVLSKLMDDPSSANMITLILLGAMSTISSSAVTHGLQLINRILQHADKSQEKHLEVMCHQLNTLIFAPAESVQKWLHRLVLGCVNDCPEDVLVHAKLLFKFSELLVKKESSVNVLVSHRVLSMLLPLGSELVTALPKEPHLLPVFREFFHCCTVLAWRQADEGHLVLARAAVCWLPDCTNLVTTYKWKQNIEELLPVSTLLSYLSTLTSAVQLTTNKVECTKRRNLSLEDDLAYLECDGDGEEEDEITEEYQSDSDDEALNNQLCTFTETRKEFRNQHWYHCHTCKLVDGTGCCSVCVKVCHKGHDVTYSKYGSFFCDCGVKDDGSCKALVKRAGIKQGESDSRGGSPLPVDGDPFEERRKRKSRRKKESSKLKKLESRKKYYKHTSSSPGFSFPSNPVQKLSKLIENYKFELKDFLDASSVIVGNVLEVVHGVLPYVVSSVEELSGGGSTHTVTTLRSLHTKEKKTEHSDHLMSTSVGCQEGALENVRMNLSGDQNQGLRLLLSAGAIRRSAMCCLVSSSGQKQHLVVSHDKGKLTILQLSSLLKQADSNRRKLTLIRLSTTTVPFTVLSVTSNLCSEQHFAVCGLRECVVLTVSPQGQVTERLLLHPSVNNSGYIVKALWLPGSQTVVALVTDTFVKIYDLSSDAISPSYYYILCSGKIRDACIVIKDDSKLVLVITNSGHIFCHPITPEFSASEGPVYFTVQLSVQHSTIQEKDDQIGDGGASIYYSHALRMLFFSYQNGKSYMASVGDDLSKTKMVFEICLKSSGSGDKSTAGNHSSLVQWSEVPQHPGIVCALTQTNNAVVLLVRPDVIQIHELKSLPAKSKIQGFVVVRQPTSPGESPSQHRTTMILLCEDGSLRIHLTGASDSIMYWLQPQFKPSSPLACLNAYSMTKVSTFKRRDGFLRFPVDFFEHCQRMPNNEVDFLGNDILHIYNKEQVKHRFNVGGLYIANTKPGGFTLEVSNLQSDATVMVGVRVLLGCRSLERAPSFFEVFGRNIPVSFPSGCARWFDMPFTREESLCADKSFKINFGPSLEPSGINMVDCIRVYSKTKDDFGWPEQPPTSSYQTGGRKVDQKGEGQEEGFGEGEVVQAAVSRTPGPVDRLVCNAFAVVGNYCLSSVTPELKSSVANLMAKTTPLLMLNMPPSLQYHTKFLVSCAIVADSSYDLCKDHLLLSHSVQLFSDKSMEPDQFQRLLLVFLAIARARPHHLNLIDTDLTNTLNSVLKLEGAIDLKPSESVVKKEGDREEIVRAKEGRSVSEPVGSVSTSMFVDKLNQLFWKYYKQRPKSVAVAPVCGVGLVAVETTVSVITEIMWTFACQSQQNLLVCVPHLIQLITAVDYHISSACVHTLIKLLKPTHHKLSMSAKPAEEEEESKAKVDDKREVDVEGVQQIVEPSSQAREVRRSEGREAPPPPHPLIPQEMLGNPAAIAQVLNGHLGLVPDEEAMMNLAIALSLHEDEGVPDAAQMLEGALQGLGLPAGVSVQVNAEVNSSEMVREEDVREEQDDQEDREDAGEAVGDRSEPSLTSSYEDLAAQREIETPQCSGEEGPGKEKDEGNEMGKASQDVCSELEMVNDSSGEDEPEVEDASFLASLSEHLDKAEEEDEEALKGDKGRAKDVEAALKAHDLQLQLLSSLLNHLHTVEEVGGTRAVPYMQLILSLTNCLKCTRKDSEAHIALLSQFLNQLDMSSDDMTGIVQRSCKSELQLLILRFFSILMSSRKRRTESSKSKRPSTSHMLWFTTARTLLYNSQCTQFCLKVLKALISSSSATSDVQETASPTLHGGKLLKIQQQVQLVDMGPFFQNQYVRSHSNDVFEAYTTLLADIVLALPCQLKKFSEKTRLYPPLEFSDEWIETLCEYFMVASKCSGPAKKQVRKVLVYLCGSKEKYRLVRDKHILKSYLNKINAICCAAGFDPTLSENVPLHVSYKTLLTLVDQLKVCDEIACSRTANWQVFCLEEKHTLPFLLRISLVIDDGLAPRLLQLLHAAISGTHQPEKESKKSTEEKAEEKEDTEVPVETEKHCQELTRSLLNDFDEGTLVKFIRKFLLYSNSSNVRWQCHSFLYCLYRYSSSEQVRLVQLLWQLWKDIPTYGHKASQFVDILGYCTISTQELLEQEPVCQYVSEQAIQMLRKQNAKVASHPNAHVYSQLASLVDFDGYYLESEPCLVCNEPEVPYMNTKLLSIKSEVRYSPNTVYVKLVGAHMFSQLTIRINEIKRNKMIRSVNIYYSSRTVQNVIELKNKRSLWLKAHSCILQPGQSELKVEFPLPIVARNIIIEYSDFYDNAQGVSEVLHCPRCNAAVPAHPGVCGSCGENVHQCHKCRAINYDERDPFLCNSCGFSKYGRFDILVEVRSCSAVDPIESEEDRQKTLSSINHLLEKADSVYRTLVTQRNDLDHLLVALASGATIRESSSLSSESGVNKAIQVLAQLYCQSCKTSYLELSKTIQGVLASRRELVSYDMKKLQSSNVRGGKGDSMTPVFTSEPPTPVTPESSNPILTPSDSDLDTGHCFNCASATLEHCITLLKALAFRQQTKEFVVKQNLIHELMEFNLHSGISQMQKDVQGLLCQLSRDNPIATCELNNFIEQHILEHIKQPRTAPNLASAIQPEVQLISASVTMQDTCWEQRLKTVISLFSKARSHKSPVVMAAVTMPCLRLLQSLINPQSPTTTINKDKSSVELSSFPHLPMTIHTKVKEWLKGDPSVSFNEWKKKVLEEVTDKNSSSGMDSRQLMLAKRYCKIWKRKTIRPHVSSVVIPEKDLHQVAWLRCMLFSPSSRGIRKTMCGIIYSLCKEETRQRQILNLLSSFLDEVGVAGEAAHEFLDLFRKLSEDAEGKWKVYLSQTGLLQKVAILIEREIAHLQTLEESTLSSDLSQGYALKMLTALLQSFLQVESIKQHYKGQLVRTVLSGYLSLRRLVVQRTKKIDECQELLLQMIETLTTGTEEESMDFMTICVDTLRGFPRDDTITPIFVIERLCNIIRPEEEDVGEFFMSLEKDPQQEEFLQGRMQGNPYRSRDSGLGPLMRDVKNKICTDCELVALLDDDTGMELLVCNKIISLDLPVKQVYKKIWCAQPNHGECMKIVYRMRGLLGDATEDMVESLSDGKGEDVDEEEVFKMAAVLSKCGGIEAILNRLAHVRDFVHSHELLAAALKLLGFCVKLKINRQYLMCHHLNTLNILLGILNLSLKYEQQESNGLGASVAQQVLSVTESVLQEASSQQQVVARTISEEVDIDSERGDEEESALQALLSHIESPFVQSNLDVREGLMHIIPFLTFGDPRNMTVLLDHFAPYLNFQKFDAEKSPENALYLDCFCVVANRIGNDASGEKLKDLAIEMKLTPSALEYIKTKVPKKGSGGRLDTADWKEFISQPSLPHILKMLRGLCQHHTKTQLMVCDVVEQLHLLEQVSSAERIGTLAENLLERLRDNPICYEKIQDVRSTTRTEKRRRAMAMRAKELQQLGMKVNEKGQVTMSKESPFKELESDIVEETGLKCCICLEGYKNQPQKILGVYTFTKKVALDEFESKSRKTVGYSTVSHFNVVHYECHSAAVKLARGRDEWESATLQNANTRCNGILPIWGPEVSESAFASSLARHNGYLQECTGLYDASFRSYVHDLRLLLLRFAMEKSFSAESGGGGSQSNIHLIPYLMHVALYVIDTTRVFLREENALSHILTLPPTKWVSSAYELEGPVHGLVLSLFILTLDQWKHSKLTFIKQLLVLAHARNVSSTPIGSLPPPMEPAVYEVYKPMCIFFAVVDGLHYLLKTSVESSGKELPRALLEYIRKNDATVLEDCDKLLSKYHEELLPMESFEEFCDVAGLLGMIDKPDVFLSELIRTVTY